MGLQDKDPDNYVKGVFGYFLKKEFSCPKCGGLVKFVIPESLANESVLSADKIFKVWVRRLGIAIINIAKIAEERKTFDTDMQEISDIASKAWEKMYIESEIKDVIDDGKEEDGV